MIAVRELREADLRALDDETRAGLLSGRAAAAAHADVSHRDELTITNDGAVVGVLALARSRSDPGLASVGVTVVPFARGRGVASEALRRLTQRAARDGLTELCAFPAATNLASRRAFERAGFTATGGRHDNGGLIYRRVLHGR